METNGIIVPDPGSDKQYIQDPIGGWMYIVTTSITVEQQSLEKFKAHVEDVKAQIETLQALVAEIEPAAASFDDAVKVQEGKDVTPE